MNEFFSGIVNFLELLIGSIDEVVRTFWVESLGLSEKRYEDCLWTILVVLVYLLLRRYVVAPVSRHWKTPSRRYSSRKIGNGFVAALALGVTAIVWIDTGGQDIVTLLGIVGAGLAVAMQDVIMNFLGWVFILVREPFSVKDRIQIADGLKGDVVDVRLFMFSLLEVGNWVDAEQSTGRIVHVPNSVVFRQAIANYTQGFKYIWAEIPVTVTFESDWQKAHAILTTIIEAQSKEAAETAAAEVRETSTRFMVYYTRMTPIVWTSVVDIGVTLTMRYICDARRRRSSAHGIWGEVLRAFAAEPTIDFAYPTMRYYDNRAEGKPGAGGPAAGAAPPASAASDTSDTSEAPGAEPTEG